MAKEVFSMNFDGRTLTIETGELAKQAGGAVLTRYGDTVILSTACASNVAKDTDFFPLTVSFEEKLYSVGKIPGGFLRREGRPSEQGTLTARLIDRPIRPLFAEGFRNEVQQVNTALSIDQDCSYQMTAMFGASLALGVSNIPFEGPIAGVIVGRVDGKFIINPTVAQTEASDLHLTIAGKKDAIMMVEAGAAEISEEDMLSAFEFAQPYIAQLCEFQEEIIAKVGKEKMEVTLYEVPADLKQEAYEYVYDRLKAAVSTVDKLEREKAIDDLTKETIEYFESKEYASESEKAKAGKYANEVCTQIVADEVRRLIVEDKIRPDGRKVDEIRPLDAQVDLLPRVHGSGLFTRGQTQVLSVTTLGALGDNQIIDDLTEVEEKRFMHHYNFPPYCVGEVGRMGSPGRREIGHGALGERALKQVLPSEDEFPYAIRTVAEVLESNGSSSQASICAGTLSLMAAGVPIKAPVAGIAMGLIEGENGMYTILTDIQGMEDHFGDMDFKVAGTREGITALQMDIKVQGITSQIMAEAMAQAKKARFEILDVMEKAIDKPREHVSTYAPKIAKLMIPVDKIRDVIGTGGKTINQIIEASNGTKIDISDEGRVLIYHDDQASIDIAVKMVQDLTRTAKVGEIYDAKVVRIESYGAFVELFPGTDALVHVSDLRWERVDKPSDVLKMDEIVKVQVKEIDEKGRVNASIKVLLDKPEGYEEIRDYSNNRFFTGGKSNNNKRNNTNKKKPAKKEQ